MTETEGAHRVREILAAVKPLAAEYYQLTGKPLGVTGEVAEYVAAQTLRLELAPPRTKGYDAIRKTSQGEQRIQIDHAQDVAIERALDRAQAAIELEHGSLEVAGRQHARLDVGPGHRAAARLSSAVAHDTTPLVAVVAWLAAHRRPVPGRPALGGG